MPYASSVPQGSNVSLTRTTVDRASALEADRAGASCVNTEQFFGPILSKSVLVGPSGCILILSDSNYNFFVDGFFVGQLTGASQSFGSPSSFIVASDIVPGWHSVHSDGDEGFYLVFAL